MKPLQRILIVEDDADTASKYQRAFQSIGQSRTAERIDQVFREILDFSPTLILLDIVLEGEKVYPPETAGLHVLEAIRGLRNPFGKIPVVVVTALVDSETEIRCKELGTTSFLRKPTDLQVLRRAVEEAAPDPLRILFLAANPNGTSRLQLDEEIRALDLVLKSVRHRDKIELSQASAVRFSDLQTYLLQYKPHIVHFSGHGCETGEILFKDEAGNILPVRPDILSNLFSTLRDNIQCVVLNACHSEQQAQAIAEHIPCVISMTRAIEDKAAIRFSRAFYEAIGFGRNLETAFKLGCNQLDPGNSVDQGIPKLIALRARPEEIILLHDI